MSIFLNKDSKVIVQGITGGEGTKHTALMLAAGTQVVGGVNARKAGTTVTHGDVTLPVFAGVMPTSASPGVMMPGQFGPMMRVVPPLAFASAQNSAESCTGMPSVITTTSGMPASMASTTASFANTGGTKTIDTSAPVSAMASVTEPKTGSSTPPSCVTVVPALRALTPPTTWVPALSIRAVCLVPSPPVMPWTMTLESLLR